MLFTKPSIQFEAIKSIYQSYNIDTSRSVEIKLGTRIFEAWPSLVSEPIYIVDQSGIIHSKRKSIVLKRIPEDTIDSEFQGQTRAFILDLIKDVRVDENWSSFKKYTYGADYAFNDPIIGEFVNVETKEPTDKWKELIHDILEFNCKKDPSVVLSDKAVFSKGWVMKYQPHKLIITPPSVGKSVFGAMSGARYDKITKNSALGSVKGIDEKIQGMFHNQYYPLYIEQIESQPIENALGFLLTFLEDGHATINGAGVDLNVDGACSLIITANQADLRANRISTLRDIIMKLNTNTFALGRRFGILAYGNYKSLEDFGYDDVAHRELIETFRALEERCSKTLTDIWMDEKIRDYCLKPVYHLGKDEEDEVIMNRVNVIESIETRSFLRGHLQYSGPHIRGGSLNMAIVDLLPVIALRDILSIGSVDEIVSRLIVKAEDYTSKLKKININSILYATSENTNE